MWIPSDSVSVAKTTLTSPSWKSSFDQLLEEGQQPRVVD